jgi:RNA polymerase sigma-70 factor (TIGR02960 family)
VAAPREEFDRLTSPFRAELHRHCYRMLGSLQDADDALQEALLGAWRGFAGFEARSSLRAWLYKIATNAALALLAQRRARQLPNELGPSSAPDVALDSNAEGVSWLEPYPTDEQDPYELRESVELAFVAALQHLPGNQRAALLLREVVGLSAQEAASLLDTSVASVENALQRSRKLLAERKPAESQQLTLRRLGDEGRKQLVTRYVDAWRRADAQALAALLAEDVKFTMPPIPNWFMGRADVVGFFAQRVFATPWRLTPTEASGQLAFACYQGPDFRLGALNVVTLRGGLTWRPDRGDHGFSRAGAASQISFAGAMSFGAAATLKGYEEDVPWQLPLRHHPFRMRAGPGRGDDPLQLQLLSQGPVLDGVRQEPRFPHHRR